MILIWSFFSGDIEDFPGLDSLPCYNVAVLPNGDVKVSGSKSLLEANKRVKCMAKKTNSKETIVIIGGGLFFIMSSSENVSVQNEMQKLSNMLKNLSQINFKNPI